MQRVQQLFLVSLFLSLGALFSVSNAKTVIYLAGDTSKVRFGTNTFTYDSDEGMISFEHKLYFTNGIYIGWIGGGDNYMEFKNIQIPTAGSYRVGIGYFNGSGEGNMQDRAFAFTPNNGETQNRDMPYFTYWETSPGPFPAPVQKYNRIPRVYDTLTFQFNQGNNVLRIGGTGEKNAPDLDRIEVYLPGPNDKLPKPVITTEPTNVLTNGYFTDSVKVSMRDSVQPTYLFSSKSGGVFKKDTVMFTDITVNGSAVSWKRHDPYIVLKDSATIRVYATAPGFDQSDTVVMKFCKGAPCAPVTSVTPRHIPGNLSNLQPIAVVDGIGRRVAGVSRVGDLHNSTQTENLKPGVYIATTGNAGSTVSSAKLYKVGKM
jgi:hypothetical protein